MLNAQDEPLEIRPTVTLCRCGASKNQPFCDGTHNEIGFDSAKSDDHTQDLVTVYEGESISIHYNRLLCSRAGICGSSLNTVFNSSRTPWIMPDEGERDEIIRVLRSCPSGALSYSENGESATHVVDDKAGIKIEENGPYHVSRVHLESTHFAHGACHEKYTLCRCGASKNKPFCDGSHCDVKWKDAQHQPG